jgi:hypothetical protein
METEIIKSSETTIQNPQPKQNFLKRVEVFLREIFAILFWCYGLTEIFVFNIDTLVIEKIAPSYTGLLNFKLFIFLVIVATFWLFFGNKTTSTWFFYTLFYPIILIFWKIPSYVFKQKSWTLAFALINSIISFFKSAKFNFISASFFFASFVVIFISSNKYLLSISVIFLSIITFLFYVRKFWFAVRSSDIFNSHIKFFKQIRKFGSDSFVLEKEIRDLSIAEMNEQQVQKRTEKIQFSVLFNRICLFSAKKLRDYQNSGLQFVPLVFTILSLIIFTAIAFTGINYGVFKIDPSIFNFTHSPTLFTFFYYSFRALVFNDIPELVPTAQLSQSILMVEEFTALILVAIFITLYFSVKSEKKSAELEKAINEIEAEGESMECFIRDEYKFANITDALEHLQKLKSNMLSIILWLSKGL